MTAPLLWAALRADLPFTTVSRAAPPPRVLLPIFVTVSQSSIVPDVFARREVRKRVYFKWKDWLLWRERCLRLLREERSSALRNIKESADEAVVAHDFSCRMNHALGLIRSRSRSILDVPFSISFETQDGEECCVLIPFLDLSQLLGSCLPINSSKLEVIMHRRRRRNSA